MSSPSPTDQSAYRQKRPSCGCLCTGLLISLVIVIAGAAALYDQIAPAIGNFFGRLALGGRTNILLLGSDTDGKGNDPNNGVPLAQTILIITIDPQSNYIGMLSIPRDMQVTEDGYTEPKLDEVFSHGYTGSTLQEKIARGAGEMEDIIQSNFGIRIDRYAWVGLDGFVKVIDTAGGIDVDIIHPMVDDTYPDDVGKTNGSVYDYRRLSIAPGPQHLDGAQALAYVRTRHSDLIGDFGRTIRQQQIITQLKTKLATPDTIGKASQLSQDLNGTVQTDMQLSQIVNLANFARDVDGNSVDHLTLGPPTYATLNTKGDRPGNYLPICSKVVPAIQRMFNTSASNCMSQAKIDTSSQAQNTASVPNASNTAVLESRQTLTSHGIVKNDFTANTEGDAGARGLLDVMFAVAFESFDGLQV